MSSPTDWQSIESAPRDGTVVEVCREIDGVRMFEHLASWRVVTFSAFINGRHGVEPERTVEGWALRDEDKLAPTPTHWRALTT